MARYRRVAHVGPRRSRWGGCLGTIMFLAVIAGLFVAFRSCGRTRRRPPPQQPAFQRWQETEPGKAPAKASPAPTPTAPSAEQAPPAAPAEAGGGAPAAPAEGAAAPATRTTEQALAAAQTCLGAGDTACCIRELQGVEETMAVLTTLVTCYEQAGQLEQGCALARRHPECRACQSFVTARCGAE